jgi:hypothetical protein
MKLNIKNNDNLVRDMNSMAVLNVSKASLAKDTMYKEKLRREKEVDSAINKLNDEVSDIRQSVSKILEILSSRGP